MNNEQRRAELAHFLRTRRERLTPAIFDLQQGAKRRRTPGLRREELALLAGISPAWYMKLEQGQDIQVSVQVLESLSRVLHLTPSERKHFYMLAREELPLPIQNHTARISEDLQAVLDALNPHPIMVMNERQDVLGWNRAASQVFAPFDALSDWERNWAWIMFTQADQRTLFINWEYWAQQTLALFRASGGHRAGEPWFVERRDRLMQASKEFRAWWQRHDITDVRIVHKELNHPLVGSLVLRSTPLLAADDPNLTMFVFTPLQPETARKLAWLVSPTQTDVATGV